MLIRSTSLTDPMAYGAFCTITDEGVFFTSYGVGSMTGDAAQLSDSAKATFVKFLSICEESGRWRKELAFFQVKDANSAEGRVREALLDAESDTAIFFVCASLEACYAVRKSLNPEKQINPRPRIGTELHTGFL
jgi:hypothetical protein